MTTGLDESPRNARVQSLLTDVEALLNRTANGGMDDAELRELRRRINESIEDARASLRTTSRRVRNSAASAARTADDYVHQSPWRVLGVTAVAALAVGLIAARR